ncbi:thioredoxin domain-containing protein [Catellatospora sp. NPDC049609]|uniref:thioredoxin domain-containing protein n=1 Tax=Catellatospora sp. NPDC049609 TaxID=3155505 RepID=UPI00342E0276
MNRLGDATSPYLLQHADNPVHWWPWCEEAFAEAKQRDVPVLISVGYAACHWCHVMAHESFEDAVVGDIVNENFVAIKVDREERPDVDAVYMSATQAMTGQGGWPMTVFAAPDGKPFLCGTYYPKAQFTRLLGAVADAWRDQRRQVLEQGDAVVEAIARNPLGGGGEITKELLDHAVELLRGDYDTVRGGFGGAPKFPPHMLMLFLLRHHRRAGDAESLELARHTGEAMARGGIYDQLAGGFHRYAVDATWTVPHFEKMLYDNALLLRAYNEIWRLTGDPLAQRIATETALFMVNDLQTAEGGFASALDADTEGVEGTTYSWTPAQLVEVLGEQDAAFAADLFGVTDAGTFEHGASVLVLRRDIDDAAPEVQERWARVRGLMMAARRDRAQPMRDDKVVASWNGLAITALCEFWRNYTEVGGEADVEEVDFRAVAVEAGELLLTRHLVDGRLRRVSRDGVVGQPAGVLEDHGCVAEAFCALHQVTGDGRWLAAAGVLLDVAAERFRDGEGGFHDTADDAERLVIRPADPTDNATPSGLSSLVNALLSYAALSGEPRWREMAERALSTVAPLLAGHPRFAGYAAAGAEALLSGPYEIAIATTDPESDPLLLTAIEHAPPGAVIVAGHPDAPGVPLLTGRTMVDGLPTAYVCRGFVCDRPVTTTVELATILG